MEPYFDIDQIVSFADEKIVVKLKQLPTTINEITIIAESTDFYCINAFPSEGVGTVWQAAVTYDVKADEVFCLDTAEAIAGNYIGVQGMGLFYYMKPIEKKRSERSDELTHIQLNEKYHITLTAYANKQLLCETTLTRKYMNDDIVYEDIHENQLLARFFYHQEKLELPTIIVLSGSDGRIEKAQNIAQVLTRYGFNTLAICYFGLNGTNRSLNMIPIDIVENAVAWLKKKTRTCKIAIYGRSKGGEGALLAASEISDITCVVANTPSNYIFEGINSKGKMSKQSSWTYQGDEYAFVPFKLHIFLPYIIKKILFGRSDFRKAYTHLLEKYGNERNQIKIENINGPLLFLSAKNDEIWPSAMFCENMEKYLLRHKFNEQYEHACYSHAGHMLTIAYQPNPRYKKINNHFMLEESMQSWNKTITFLKKWCDKD